MEPQKINMKKQHSDIGTIHNFPTKSPVRDGIKAIMNMDSSKVRPFPSGHLEFPVPDNAQYIKDDGSFIPNQFYLERNNKENNLLKPIRFHHLVKYVQRLRMHYKQFWVFECKCGNRVCGEKSRYRANRLRNCGCVRESIGKPKVIHSKPNIKGLHDGSRDIENVVRPYAGETVEMFTGNAHRKEGRVVVSIDDAYRVWDGELTLEEVIKKKQRMGDNYFILAKDRKHTKQMAIDSERAAIRNLQQGVGRHNW